MKTLQQYEIYFDKFYKSKKNAVDFINEQNSFPTQKLAFYALKKNNIQIPKSEIVWKKHTKKQLPALTKNEFKTIINLTDQENVLSSGLFFINLQLETGLRIHEIPLFLKKILENGFLNYTKTVWIIGKGEKDGAIWITKRLWKILQINKSKIEHYSKLQIRSISKQIDKILVDLNLKTGSHSLRRTCATNLYRCGVRIEIISKILRHSSLEMTINYIGITDDEIISSLEFVLNDNLEMINENNFRTKFLELLMKNQKQAEIIKDFENGKLKS